MHTSSSYSRRVRRAILIGAATIAAAASLLTVPAAFADTADEVTWTVRTASNERGDSRTSFGYTVEPGSSVSDGIVITNRGAQAVELDLYAIDGYTSDDGQLALLVAGEESHGVGAWVTPDNDHITVGPGQVATVPFTVSVPQNATPGDYAGGVVTSLTVPDQAAGVNVDRRLAVRLDLRVGGELAPSLSVDDVHVAWNGGWNPFVGGDATLTYTLHNTGNVSASAAQTAQVSGLFGMFPTDADAVDPTPTLLPGEEWTQTVTVRDVPAVVLLTATATLTPLVTDAAGSTAPLDAVTASATGWAVPWTLLILVLLLAVAAVLFFRGRRGRKRARDAGEAERVERAVAEALAQERAKASATTGD
ncbi:DUF916 domain-containing protein [Microbacterium sp. cx-55]|uniref:WxL protein peptidoglycan domain-containing protein n=1 Tax=Microbacterium sp. cx-55 TaxID=2875948 RepID=UPI001CBF05DD|nr:DUF916 domain-containing protein [Microbacterium sp. cx-55]MBZ4486293.1 DUF916 domain-containing protein [Microbacterium sp. cx-55]UGB33867.1 DUF916 domain-containing protein [Microbacterium sp. cx-55]